MPVRLGLVLTSARADHPFCSAAFCSTHLCRHYFALACFALPRRNGSSARPGLGHHHECVDDQFLRRFLCLLHLAALLLALADFAICPDWDGRRRSSWLARFDTDPTGQPAWGTRHGARWLRDLDFHSLAGKHCVGESFST